MAGYRAAAGPSGQSAGVGREPPHAVTGAERKASAGAEVHEHRAVVGAVEVMEGTRRRRQCVAEQDMTRSGCEKRRGPWCCRAGRCRGCRGTLRERAGAEDRGALGRVAPGNDAVRVRLARRERVQGRGAPDVCTPAAGRCPAALRAAGRVPRRSRRRSGPDTLLHLRSASFHATIRTLDKPYRCRSAALFACAITPRTTHPVKARGYQRRA